VGRWRPRSRRNEVHVGQKFIAGPEETQIRAGGMSAVPEGTPSDTLIWSRQDSMRAIANFNLAAQVYDRVMPSIVFSL